MKGSLPSIQAHCKLESVGGCQDVLFEMGGMLVSTGVLWLPRMSFKCSWLDSIVAGELIGVWGTMGGSIGLF